MSVCRFVTCVAVVGLMLTGAACHKKTARARVPRAPTGGSSASAEAAPGSTEYGYASWYGNPYHGRKTSSGEVYNMYAFTAAHRTLPLGTQVQITNLENSAKVIVRINDRGPFVDNRIIDLSLAAARQLSIVGPGTALVQITVLKSGTGPAAGPAPSGTAARFTAQVGAFGDRRNAERLCSDLTRRYPQYAVKTEATPDGRLYRVRVGEGATEQQASAIVERLRHDGLAAFAIRLD